MDCSNCFGRCCVALAFAKSANFPFDKPASEPCLNLDGHDGCQIHPHLRDRGLKGCTVFDCFGAGQKVSQPTFAGRSWREDPETRAAMFSAADLRGTTIRGSVAIAADLSRARMARCDVLGVDMRDVDLSGADLYGAIYLTQMQVNSARGDSRTVLPQRFERPSHWGDR